MAAHKNTVETDQESSFVQAVAQYVAITGDYDYLKEARAGKTVLEHLEDAMSYLRHEKWNDTYGLITGATTADWGDVQPEHGWGVEIDENTHYTIDIYDNAMFALALDELCMLEGGSDSADRWLNLRDTLRKNIRTHLWDAKRQKFRPHIYLNGSPFPADFNEDEIYYHGGTAVAALAGILMFMSIRIKVLFIIVIAPRIFIILLFISFDRLFILIFTVLERNRMPHKLSLGTSKRQLLAHAFFIVPRNFMPFAVVIRIFIS